MTLPPEAFTPPPKISSAVVHLKALPAPKFDADQKTLEMVVARAFSQRRKMLRAALKGPCAGSRRPVDLRWHQAHGSGGNRRAGTVLRPGPPNEEVRRGRWDRRVMVSWARPGYALIPRVSISARNIRTRLEPAPQEDPDKQRRRPNGRRLNSRQKRPDATQPPPARLENPGPARRFVRHLVHQTGRSRTWVHGVSGPAWAWAAAGFPVFQPTRYPRPRAAPSHRAAAHRRDHLTRTVRSLRVPGAWRVPGHAPVGARDFRVPAARDGLPVLSGQPPEDAGNAPRAAGNSPWQPGRQPSCASRANWLYFSMICCGVPRTLPSGPELSKTRFTTLPTDRLLRLFLFRERDFDDLMLLAVQPYAQCVF